ncbi:bacillithiol system redox-active protein YtxJ [Marinilongibacter aquaticus]|nr:bacillithiol system redox-active protein YtxJ [Marinilongibacter aquaticus]
MNWNLLTNESQLDEIIAESANQAVAIFKHSTTCPISSTAKSRLERSWDNEAIGDFKIYYLDLLSNRPLSNAIAQKFGVEHESPQILVIKDGKAIYHESHFGISFEDLQAAI